MISVTRIGSDPVILPIYRANRACTECSLRSGCLGPVPGIGTTQSDVMFVGESPGQGEDEDGLPFTGQAGQLLRSLLSSIGYNRSEVFITNMVKCWMSNTPTAAQSSFCADKWLDLELRSVRPKIVVALGAVAIHYLTGDLRLTVEHSHGVPVQVGSERWGFPFILLPMYNPAAGLRDTRTLRHVFDDFEVLGKLLNGATIAELTPTDWYPNPHYIQVTNKEWAAALLSQPEYALDTETIPGPDGKHVLWSVQVSMEPGTGFFIPVAMMPFLVMPSTSKVICHNYLYDSQFVGMPNFVDTMVMAYLLGLPQGLKELAFRLAGMVMNSYDDQIRHLRDGKAIDYLNLVLANGFKWSNPEPISDTKWDNKAGKLVVKVTNPQHIVRKTKKILTDRIKDPTTDPSGRWNKFDYRERKQVEEAIGLLPEPSLADIPVKNSVHYSSKDADATWRCYQEMTPEIRRLGLEYTLHCLDLPTVPVIAAMMNNGMAIDIKHFDELAAEYVDRLNVVADEAAVLVGGRRFNPNSGPQVAKLLYEDMGYEITKRTDTGLASTDDRELKKIDHPVVAKILEYRGLEKNRSSYAEAIPPRARLDQYGVPRVHATITCTRTETGRLATRDPNLTAIPVRSVEGKRIRQGFVSTSQALEVVYGPEYLIEHQIIPTSLFAVDYSQIEMRVLAHISNDPALRQVFLDGLDIHTATAALLFSVSMEEAATDRYRYPTKRLNFGIVYGITAEGLYEGLREEGVYDFDLQACQQLIDDYNRVYPGVLKYRRDQVNYGLMHRFVRDLFGRIRYIPELFCPVRRIKAEGERAASNMPVQATATGIIKLATNNIMARKPELLDNIRLQVHDELIFELEDWRIPSVGPWIINQMESAVHLSVPVICDAEIGKTWADMEKWEPEPEGVGVPS